MKRLILLTIAVILSTIAISQFSHASSISIDAVGGTWSDGVTVYTCPNLNLTFDIRYTNNSGNNIAGITNGFIIWTTGGSSFTPITVEMLYPGFEDYFDLVFAINIFSDGVGSDTIGIGGSKLIGSGLPDGFDDVVYRIKTGGVQEGETICIDSSFYSPSGTWKWAVSGGDIFPDWSGQMCFKSESSTCLPPDYFTNCVDTITNNCDTLSYTFDAYESFIMFGIKYFIIDGPGTINTNTGEWSYSIQPKDYGTTFDLVIGAYDMCICDNIACSTTVKINEVNTTFDLNNDCSSDISDLVLLVAYMFSGGTPPDPLMSADMNGDSEIDISDMVWLVDYMFNGGPPPIG